MKKKVIFREIDPTKYSNCQLMPLGTIEATGSVASGSGVDAGVVSGWTGPVMEWCDAHHELTFPTIETTLEAADPAHREFMISVKCKNVAAVEVLKVLGGSATDVPTSTREQILAECESLLKPVVKSFVEAADKGLCFLGPFWLSFRVRMSDGTSFTLPSPKLMSVNTEPLKVAIKAMREVDGAVQVGCVITTMPAKVCWRVSDAGSFADRISAIDLMATPSATVWNQPGTFRLVDSLATGEDVSGLPASPRGWMITGCSSPLSAGDPNGAVWHKFAEIAGGPKVSEDWTVAQPSGASSLSSLFSGKGETADYSACRVPVSAWITRIGGRTIALRPRFASPSSAAGYVEEPATVLDWESDGPPLVPASRRLSLAGSVPAAVARVLPGNIPDLYPALYLFSSDGVRTLKWNASAGGWKPEKYISTDRCLNPRGVIECGDDVYFMTDTGICRLSGGTVTRLSIPGVGAVDDILKTLPGAETLVGRVASPEDWEGMMRDGELRYDRSKSYMAVTSPEGELFIYDLRRGRWVSSGGSESGAEWMLTYPMDPGMSRVRSVELFGCTMTDEVTAALYVSDTLGAWRLERVSRTVRNRLGPILGTPGRFRRLLIVGSRPEGAYLTGS